MLCVLRSLWFSLHGLCALADFHVGRMDAGPCSVRLATGGTVQSVSLQCVTMKGSGRRGLGLGCFLEDPGGGGLGLGELGCIEDGMRMRVEDGVL